MDTDVLQEVDSEKVVEYKNSLKDYFPLSIHAHSFIDVILDWKRKGADSSLSILAPDGDPRNGVIVFMSNDKYFLGTIYVENDEAAGKLQEAFSLSKKIPWEEQEFFMLSCMPQLAYTAIEKRIGPHWHVQNQENVYWLPWYVAREVQVHIPEDVELRPLSKEFAGYIDENWPHQHPGSEGLFRDVMEMNFGFGIFKGEKLISWALYWFYGGLGGVHTIPEERRKGYARAVVEAVMKKLGEMQIDVHLNIVKGNKGSEAFFKALGFRHAYASLWMVRCKTRNKNT